VVTGISQLGVTLHARSVVQGNTSY